MKAQKGDIVVVNDFSYSRFIVDGKLTDYNLIRIDGEKLKKNCHLFKVVDVNIITHPHLIAYQQHTGQGDYNNTIIQSLENGIVGLIEERFLSLALHTINIDGKTIEISHESFLNLKKQLCE